MLLCKCIGKFRDDTGKLIGYRLVDIDGTIVDIPSTELKELMLHDQIEVSNLTYTVNNRIREKESHQFKEDNRMVKFIVSTTNTGAIQGIGIKQASQASQASNEEKSTLTEQEFTDGLNSIVSKASAKVHGTIEGFRREYAPMRRGEEFIIRIYDYDISPIVTNPNYRNDILINISYYPDLKQVSTEIQRVHRKEGKYNTPVKRIRLALTDPFKTQDNLDIIDKALNSLIDSILPKT